MHSITAVETPAQGNGAESTPLQAEAQIGPNETFVEAAQTMASFSYLCNGHMSYSGPWPKGQIGYLGFSFLIDGQPHVGSINPKGEITSFFVDANNVYHGFLRTREGAITTVDAPGAGTGAGQGTQAENINSMGTIVGNYLDTSGVNHGFLRGARGAFATFDAPHAGTGPGEGTTPFSNNASGAITGFEIDANGVLHGLLRTHEDDGMN